MADGDNSATQAVDPNSLAALLQQTITPPDSQAGAIAGEALPPAQQQQAPQQAATPRTGGTPLIAQYLQGLIKGGSPAQPQSRGDMTLNFLGQFLGNMAQGLSQAGHGPGANLRGAAGAIQAPYQRALQDFQVQQQAQQQQAQIQSEQSRAQLEQAQAKNLSNVVQTPYGPMSAALAAKIWPAEISKEGKTEAAKITAGGRVDVANINAAAKIGAMSPFGKMSPEMAAVGVPPDWHDATKYPLGMNDPTFRKDVQDYGSKVTDLKQKNMMAIARARGESFAYSRAKYTQVPVINRDTQEPEFKSPLEIAQNPTGFVPLAEGDKLMMKNAVFGDIQGASANLRKAINNNNEGFSAAQIAEMTTAMNSDPSGGLLRSTIQNLAKAGAKDALSPQQQDHAIAMLQAYENAYALRGVAGFGQGSDQLRDAIKATLPGPSSPKGYALKQLDAFDQQVGRLRKGVPSVAPISGTASPVQPKGGTKGDPVQALIDKYKPK